MATIEIGNGHIIETHEETAAQPLLYELTYVHDAPQAVGYANALGSYLILGDVGKAKASLLLADLIHVAENLYQNDTTPIDCQRGSLSPNNTHELLRTAGTGAATDNNLLIINGLENVIGSGSDELTKAQKFAIDSLMRWTSPDTDQGQYSHALSMGKKRKICAYMKTPEGPLQPERAALISSFAGKHALVGSMQLQPRVRRQVKPSILAFENKLATAAAQA